MEEITVPAADKPSWIRRLYFSGARKEFAVCDVLIQGRLFITQCREPPQHVMSLGTEICGDDPKLKQKISKSGQ